MYAVIKTGGKQYKVAKDDVIAVEKLVAEEGKPVTFDEVLMLDGTVGTPTVAGASVTGEVVRQFKDDKVVIFKKKRRQNYRRTKGHRQDLTLVKITDLGGAKKAAPKKAAKAEEPAAETAAEE